MLNTSRKPSKTVIRALKASATSLRYLRRLKDIEAGNLVKNGEVIINKLLESIINSVSEDKGNNGESSGLDTNNGESKE